MHLGRRGPLLLVVAGLVLAGCSSSSSGGATSTGAATGTPTPSATATTLPSVPEAFTLLPCPKKPESTIEIEGCSEHQIVRLDRQVEAAASAVSKDLPTAAARRDLVVAQLGWITYRKATCSSESDVYSGGTLAPVVYANCEVRIDKTRLSDLHAMQGEASP